MGKMNEIPVVFSKGEFERRHGQMRQALEGAGLDAILITAPASIAYAVGDPTGFQRTGLALGLSAVLLTPKRVITLVRKYERESALFGSPADEVIGYSGDVQAAQDPPAVIAATLRDQGLGTARIGYEGDHWGITQRDLQSLSALLPQAKFEDASTLVTGAATIKSEEELEVMRQASSITESGVAGFTEAVASGATEAGIAAAVLAAMIEAGSEYPYYHPFVLSGERSAFPHAIWSNRAVAPGEAIFTELSSALGRYHAPLVRTALIGDSTPVEQFYDLARAAQEAAIASIRPGASTGDVDRACREVVNSAGFSDSFRHRCGYAVGIDWVGRKALSLRPDGDEELVPGMTFHMPTNLFHPDGFGVGCSETVAVTATGSEVLSRGERALIRIDA